MANPATKPTKAFSSVSATITVTVGDGTAIADGGVEAAAFSQAIDKFKAQGATVIGVTSGNTERLAEFSSDIEKCAGKFPVAADAGAKIAKSYDATMTMKPDLSSRTSYVIGKDGRIVHVHDAMNPNQHVKETLDAVTALARPTPTKAKAKASGG